MDKYIVVYTDGSCMNNQDITKRKCGYGVFFGDNNINNKSIRITHGKITNQVAEISACICAIETVLGTEKLKKRHILIKTDSMYTINCIIQWGSQWKKNGWKKTNGDIIENIDLIKKLYFYSKNLHVVYQHVKAHTKQPNKDSTSYTDWYGNMMADKLATSAANI